MKIFNTLSGQKEEFTPIGDPVTMYVCGVNPYSDAHIGHALSYVFFDVVRRYLEYRGYNVRHVQNITDIEDNIIATANRQGVTVEELTQKYTARYNEDMAALNVTPPHVYPRAMGEIDKMIEVVGVLVEKGFAYVVGGDVYFRVRKMTDYGKLSKRDPEQMMAGTRVEAGEGKEDPMDFVLWKAAKPNEPSWESPWGKGRPGWHIECTAMSMKYLGEQIDIHGGGQDVVFPHHENEIAQSEAYSGKKPFVRYWVHNGLLRMGEEKMSKSLGNLITIRDALKTYTPDGLRVFFLSSYYRSPLTYTDESLDAAQRGADRLRQAMERTGNGQAASAATPESCRDPFVAAMDDDFNTPQAMAVLFDLARDVNKAADAGQDPAPLQAMLKELGGVLGLTFAGLAAESAGDAGPFIDLLITTRAELRQAKQFQMADAIRDRLTELGVILEDTPQGTTWKRKR